VNVFVGMRLCGHVVSGNTAALVDGNSCVVSLVVSWFPFPYVIVCLCWLLCLRGSLRDLAVEVLIVG
jgi:hypothetical protein